MPNVVRGERMGGLLTYLAGPGRANEHTEPHLVAGDAPMMAWHGEDELNHSAALSIARYLDQPRRAFDVEVAGGHVWHCSLSLRAEEGQLDDEKWGAIARDFVDRMGFGDEGGAKAPCRWVAVRHGVSTNGNDHIHIAVNLVREDGTKAGVWRDFQRAQSVARDLEREHGLQELDTTYASRGLKPGEREAHARRSARATYERAAVSGATPWAGLSAADRNGRITAAAAGDQPRWDLARRVRACATASVDEAEFVRRMRQVGLLARPRFADGRDDVVVGYSVAVRPSAGERPVWYGGGRLARDLTLPRLREVWPDTPQCATEAASEWSAARRGRRPVAPGREVDQPGPELWEQYTRQVQELREQLRAVPVEDRETWARVAGQTAGAFAAWSHRVEATPGPLAATADALAKSAHLRRSPARPTRTAMASASGAALLLIQAAQGGQGPAAEAVMLRQLANLAKALHDMHRAAGDARRAAEVAAAVRGQLAQVAARMPQPAGQAPVVDQRATDATRRAQQGQAPIQVGSPVPARLDPARSRTPAAPGGDRGGPER